MNTIISTVIKWKCDSGLGTVNPKLREKFLRQGVLEQEIVAMEQVH